MKTKLHTEDGNNLAQIEKKIKDQFGPDESIRFDFFGSLPFQFLFLDQNESLQLIHKYKK